MRCLLAFSCVVSLSCASASPARGTGSANDAGSNLLDASADGPVSDLPPMIASDERLLLQAISPGVLPSPPKDPTNGFADNPKAALLGQRLFFDPLFSGVLLDTDNDGSAGSLGKAGETGRVACVGCHIPAGGFSDTRSFQRQISLGSGWGRRRAPSLLDVGQATLIMWDGRRDSLFSQVFGPIETVVEMNSSRLYAAEQIYQHYRSDYEAIFGQMPAAFGDPKQVPAISATVTGCIPKNRTNPPPNCDGVFHGMPGDNAEFDGMTAQNQTEITRVVANVGKAIGAYERLLSCGRAPFDDWMAGNATAISNSAQRGAVLFVGKAGCIHCHSGPFMSDQAFHNVGLVPATVQQAFKDTDDHGQATGLPQLTSSSLNSDGAFSDGTDGRIPAAATSAMEGAFRTPTLRCVALRPSFMHTGQFGSLDTVVSFFASGGDPNTGYPGTNELQPLSLSNQDQADLTAFMNSLTGPGPAAALKSAPP